MKRIGILSGSILVILIGVVAIGYNVSSHKQTADADNFTPGRLIDNSVMRDTDTMSVSDIQSFIETEISEVGGCQESHSESTKWQDFGQQYMCLENYKEDITENMPECSDKYIREQFGFGSNDSRYSKAKTMCWWKGGRTNFNKNDSGAMNTNDTLGSNGRSAARLIKMASNNHDINPQVLLVLLQKEQSLLGDYWPWIIQYQSATGFGCPDDADCDPKYRGFYNQINEAARMYKEILTEDDSRTNYYPPGDNDILYNPDDTCGSSIVNIKNLATSALYNYTPYQPNQAALDNLYGTGDSCSTYGNRNFWRDFTDWFGSPTPSKDIVLMRNKDNGKIFVINKEKDLKIHVADSDSLKAWGFDKLPIPDVSTDQLSSYDDGGTLRRLAFERGTGKAYFADGQTAYHIRNQNQAKAWNLTLDNAPWLKKNTVEYLYKKKLSYRLSSPLGPEIYMMDSNADTSREIIQHYPSPTELNAWEGSSHATPVTEAYFCESYDADGNCVPRWDIKKLSYPKATAGGTSKTFFINRGNKHVLSSAMKPVYPGSTTTLGQPSLNRFSKAPEATALLKETYDTKIYLLNKKNYHHIGSPKLHDHWKPGGDGSKTKVSGAFLDMLTKSSVDSFTATDGTDSYYIKREKFKLEASLENAFTAPKAPVTVSTAVLDLYPEKSGIGTPYVSSPKTSKIFFLDGSGTKHHIGSLKQLELMRKSTDYGTVGLPHSMIKGMDSGASARFQFTVDGTNDYVFDNGFYHKVTGAEWELNPSFTVASASLSDWFNSAPNLDNDFKFGSKYGAARNGTLYTTGNVRLGKLWDADNNSTAIGFNLVSVFDRSSLSPFVKNPDEPHIYIYDNSELFRVPNVAALKNLGWKRFNGTVKFTSAEITDASSGTTSTYILDADNGVMDDGKRRHFPNSSTATEWGATGDENSLARYSNVLINLLKQKTNTTKVSRLITSPKTSKYYCMYGGEKRWVTSSGALNNSECRDEPLRGVSHKLLRQIPTGDNI